MNCVKLLLVFLLPMILLTVVQAKGIGRGGFKAMKGRGYSKSSSNSKMQRMKSQKSSYPKQTNAQQSQQQWINNPKPPIHSSKQQDNRNGYVPKGKGFAGMGTPFMAGAAGAVGGLYLGHQLGKMTHGYGLGHSWGHHNMHDYYRNPYAGYYGYYKDDGQYQQCPPPKVESHNGTLYVPFEQNKDYDRRCQYFAKQPSAYYTGDFTATGNLPTTGLWSLAAAFFIWLFKSGIWPMI